MKNLISALFLCITFQLQAQYVRPGGESASPSTSPATPPKPSFWDNVSAGGSFQCQIGGGIGSFTFIGVEPLINYHFNSSFMIGVGPIYQYLNDIGIFQSSTYGGRIAAMYFLPGELSKVFIMGEFDILNLPEYQINSYGVYVETRENLEIPLMGIGYKEPVSQKLFFTIYALWDFSNSPYSPYYNPDHIPTINAGFDIGI